MRTQNSELRTQNSELRTRSYGLDALKILASLGVVMLHVSAYSRDFGLYDNFTLTSFIYYLGTLSIPIFFTVSGYFLLKKTDISWPYIGKKIANILLVSLFWSVIIWLIGLNFEDNFFEKYIGSFFQKGYFYQFWYLGSLMLIYLMLPLLVKVRNKKALFLVSTLMSSGMMVASLVLGRAIQSEIPQTLRFWTWMNYFLLGGIVDEVVAFIKLKKKEKTLLLLAAILTIFLPFYIHMLSNLVGNYYAEYYYDTLYVKVVTIVLVSFFRTLRFSVKGLIGKLSNVTTGIFILHTYVIKVVVRLFSLENPFVNLLFIIAIYVMSGLLVYLLRLTKIGRKLLTI